MTSKPDDLDAALARARARLSSAPLGSEAFALIVESLPARQREVLALMAEAIADGQAPDPHAIAKKLGCHYTSAKRTMDRLTRSLAASVDAAYDIRNIPRNIN
ncbi:hypothetical protein D3C72_880450 [compost metagenome]